MKRKKPRPLGEVAAKPTERENRPLTRYRGSSPKGRALRDAQLYGCEFCVIYFIPPKCYFSAEAPAVRLGTRFLFRESFYLHTTM